MTHTPGPWKFYEAKTTAMLDDLKDEEKRTFRIYADSFGMTVHHVATGIIEANAELIVRACNSHDELLEALKRLVLAFDVGDMKHTTLNGRGYVALDESRAAITNAEKSVHS